MSETETEHIQPDTTEVDAADVEHSDDAEVSEPEAAIDADGVDADGVDADGVEEDETGAVDQDDESGEATSSLHDRLEHEGDVAADYLEELLDIADLDGDLDMDVEGDRAAVSIVGADLTHLVGDRGEVLDALQELTRLAVYRETGERSRLMLDISGHRAELRRQLEELAGTTATQVKETGEKVALRAMTPFERKVVHDAVAAAGLISESEGVEPRRYVVVLPA